MSMPSPFELGRSIGGNVAGGIQEGQELGAIDTILQQAAQSNDPNAVNNAMSQIISKVSPQNQGAALQFLQSKQAALQPDLTPYQAVQTQLRERELSQKEAKEEERAAEWEYTQHKDFKKEVVNNYNESLMTDSRLKRMKALNKKGTLTTPATAAFLDKFGIPIGVLGSPDSEEFDKLSKDFLKSISSYFPGRVNIVEVENFLKTIPSLMNSQEGRNRIIDNLLVMNEPKKLMYNAYTDIRKEGGKLPVDLREAVFDRIEPQLQNMADTFEFGAGGKVPDTSIQGDFVIMIDPSGAKRKVSLKDRDAAEQAGYKVS